MRATRDANAKQPDIELELSKKPHVREQRALAARNKRGNPQMGTSQYPDIDCFSANFAIG